MHLAVTVPEVVSFALSAAFCAWYCLEKHWLANNTLGLAFSIQGVEYISVGKLATGERCVPDGLPGSRDAACTSTAMPSC